MTAFIHHTSSDASQQSTPRKTYPQNWPAYDAAQTHEKSTFVRLLAELCSTIRQPEQTGRGRPSLPISDVLFAITTKVYSGFSSRRFSSDVRDARDKGFIDSEPHFNSVNRYIADPDLTPIITQLIEQSAIPLASVESQFAVDASGFTTSVFDRWFDHKWGKAKSQRKWLKAHVVTGTKTNIITSVKITSGSDHDSPELPALLDNTAERFNMVEVSADRAYLSDANLTHIVGLGADPFIPFKSNTTGNGSPLWRKLYARFIHDQETFVEHYHRRSNVETCFSMIKMKFGGSIRAKSETGQINEILLKILCHNLVVLVHEIYELGIDPVFVSEQPEPKIIDLNLWRRKKGI